MEWLKEYSIFVRIYHTIESYSLWRFLAMRGAVWPHKIQNGADKNKLVFFIFQRTVQSFSVFDEVQSKVVMVFFSKYLVWTKTIDADNVKNLEFIVFATTMWSVQITLPVDCNLKFENLKGKVKLMQFCEKKTWVLSQLSKIALNLKSLCPMLFYSLLWHLPTNFCEKFTKENNRDK